jgi:sugar lactone lactonase YvrE
MRYIVIFSFLLIELSLQTAFGQIIDVETYAGLRGVRDTIITLASFNEPHTIINSRDSIFYVSDERNNAIRRLSVGSSFTSTVVQENNPIRAIAISNTGDSLYYVVNPSTLKRYRLSTGQKDSITLLPDPNPAALVVDRRGNIFTSGLGSHRLVRVSANGDTISTVAGKLGQPGFAEGIDSVARFRGIAALVFSRTQDTLFILDSDNGRIRRFNLRTRVVNTFVGNIPGSPRGLAIGRNFDTMYTANNFNQTITRIMPNGVISILSGASNQVGNAVGIAQFTRFQNPTGVAVSRLDNLIYVVDSRNNQIKRLNRVGTSAFFAGINNVGNGPKNFTKLNAPYDIIRHTGKDTLYISDLQNHAIRRIDTRSGQMTLLAGTGFGGTAVDNLNGALARFNGPNGMAMSVTGDSLFVAEQFNHKIRVINTRTSRVTTLCGSDTVGFRDSQDGRFARFNRPTDLVRVGNFLYVTDVNNHRIRRVNIRTGAVNTIAGVGTPGYKDTISSFARFNRPTSIENIGNVLYIGDENNYRIRKIDIDSGYTGTLSGSGFFGNVDGPANLARFRSVQKISFDGKSQFYVTGFVNESVIRMVDYRTGEASTLTNNAPGYLDGPISQAQFLGPQAVYFDSVATNAFIAEAGNNLIRKLIIMPNTAPYFETSTDLVTVLEDAPMTTLANYATNAHFGLTPADTGQTGQYLTYPDAPLRFASLPAVGIDGTLSFHTATDSNGIVKVAVVLKDNGGDAFGGCSTSDTANLTINIIPVNDPPRFGFLSEVQVPENAELTKIPAFVSNLSPGPDNESAQTLISSISINDPSLFTVAPYMLSDTLVLRPAADVNATTQARLCYKDNGGTANGGIDSNCVNFTINIGTIRNKANMLPEQVQIYPNPAENLVVLSHPLLAKTANVEIIDILGRKLHFPILNKMEKSMVELDISALKVGVYKVLINGQTAGNLLKL